jgi:hypothetical protein
MELGKQHAFIDCPVPEFELTGQLQQQNTGHTALQPIILSRIQAAVGCFVLIILKRWETKFLSRFLIN